MRALHLPGLVAAAAISTSAFAASSFSTGFEASQNFSVGPLNTQPGGSTGNDRWLVSGGGTTANVNVTTANPAGGAQNIQLTGISDLQNQFTGAFSPIISITQGTKTVSSFDIAINGVSPGPETGGADYDIVLASRANDGNPNTKLTLVTQMQLDFLGGIDVDTGGVSLVPSGETWTPGPYMHFDITVDPSNNQITYKKDGTTFFTSTLNSGFGTTVDQIQIVSDNFQVQGERADIDNVTLAPVVPEPVFMSLLLGAGAMVLSGRTRKH